MREYQKPVVLQNDELAEGIYLASGGSAGGTEDSSEKICRFGNATVKVDDAKCKRCISSGGSTSSHVPGETPPGHISVSADQCPDKMPQKNGNGQGNGDHSHGKH